MEETINLPDVYRKLKEIEHKMATKQELEQAIETLSILSNEETVAQIIGSEKDIITGNLKEISSVSDL